MLIISPPICSPRRPITEGEWGSLRGSASSGGRSCHADLSLGEVSADPTGRPKGRITPEHSTEQTKPGVQNGWRENPQRQEKGCKQTQELWRSAVTWALGSDVWGKNCPLVPVQSQDPTSALLVSLGHLTFLPIALYSEQPLPLSFTAPRPPMPQPVFLALTPKRILMYRRLDLITLKT